MAITSRSRPLPKPETGRPISAIRAKPKRAARQAPLRPLAQPSGAEEGQGHGRLSTGSSAAPKSPRPGHCPPAARHAEPRWRRKATPSRVGAARSSACRRRLDAPCCAGPWRSRPAAARRATDRLRASRGRVGCEEGAVIRRAIASTPRPTSGMRPSSSTVVHRPRGSSFGRSVGNGSSDEGSIRSTSGVDAAAAARLASAIAQSRSEATSTALTRS